MAIVLGTQLWWWVREDSYTISPTTRRALSRIQISRYRAKSKLNLITTFCGSACLLEIRCKSELRREMFREVSRKIKDR
ncbi:hypothetical protein PUN28_015587 [Cardiocondyla obscurior]|uniref:Uncharacterized protein n=1 Tax=Cardiocondyla obscurior TaxID=286306 RepID=A0AAW2EW75_9HYME